MGPGRVLFGGKGLLWVLGVEMLLVQGRTDHTNTIGPNKKSPGARSKHSARRNTSLGRIKNRKKTTFECQLCPPRLARQFMATRVLMKSTVSQGTAEKKIVLF